MPASSGIALHAVAGENTELLSSSLACPNKFKRKRRRERERNDISPLINLLPQRIDWNSMRALSWKRETRESESFSKEQQHEM